MLQKIWGILLSPFLLSIISNEASAATEACLEIEAEVEPEIVLTRLSSGDLDFFSGNEVMFKIEANTSDGVDVCITTQGNGVAKHDESPEYEIRYKLLIKINSGEWNALSSLPALVQIPQTEFTDRMCTFSVKSEIAEKLDNILPGVYSDIVTISITSH